MNIPSLSWFPKHRQTLLSCAALLVLSILFFIAGCSTTHPPKATANTATSSTSNATALPPPVTMQPIVNEPKAQASRPARKKKAAKSSVQIDKTLLATIDPTWVPLLKHLKKDLPDIPVEQFFSELPAPSGKTMAKKIYELHHYNFVVKPSKKKDDDKKIIPEYEKSSVYSQFTTRTGMKKCTAFMAEYQAAFDLAEERHKVPREIIAGLLYVETQLGSYLGKTKAFWSLASMAASDSPKSVANDLKVTILPNQKDWLQDKLNEKSSWAYREVKALLEHCYRNNIDPQDVLGSEYGAIGICQFMPSNLNAYTDDGDGDGIIDLFNPNDAIVSTAKFLAVHGWEKAEDIAAQRKVIMRYNISSRYANTVLALGESLQTGSLKTAQADAPSRVKEKGSVAGITQKPPQTADSDKETSAKQPASSGEIAEAEKTPTKETEGKKTPQQES